jgi:hypothetical protein
LPAYFSRNRSLLRPPASVCRVRRSEHASLGCSSTTSTGSVSVRLCTQQNYASHPRICTRVSRWQVPRFSGPAAEVCWYATLVSDPAPRPTEPYRYELVVDAGYRGCDQTVQKNEIGLRRCSQSTAHTQTCGVVASTDSHAPTQSERSPASRKPEHRGDRLGRAWSGSPTQQPAQRSRQR